MIGQYFEAIIQLRPFNEEVLVFVKKQIKKAGISIAKEERLKKDKGVDLWVNSQKFAISLGRKLKKVFGGQVKITGKLYGVDRLTSKRIYRATVLFRLKEKEKEGE